MRHYETVLIADNGFNAEAITFPPVGGTGFVSFRITEPGEPGYSAPLTIRLPFSFAEKAARIAAFINATMAEDDSEDTPMVEAIADKPLHSEYFSQEYWDECTNPNSRPEAAE